MSAIEPPSLNSVETWIFALQTFLVDEIVTEIVGIDENINRLLEAIYSNTPKDLITYWGGHLTLLQKTLGNHLKNEDNLFVTITRKRMHGIGLIQLRLP